MKHLRKIYLVLMLICLVYSVSIYMVGSGTFSFVIWLAGAGFFWGAFFFAGEGRWQKVPVLFRGIFYGLFSLGLTAFIVCIVAMASHFADKGEKDLDYIVVLGAQMRNDGPSVIFKYRLDAAYDYLSENPDTVCIVSGGMGINEAVTEGDGGRAYLVSRGISPERVIAETKAIDTDDNIANSLGVINGVSGKERGNRRIGIVTNNFHVFRGVHIAKRLTSDEIYGIAAYTLPWYLPNNMVRECFGIVRDIGKMT